MRKTHYIALHYTYEYKQVKSLKKKSTFRLIYKMIATKSIKQDFYLNIINDKDVAFDAEYSLTSSRLQVKISRQYCHNNIAIHSLTQGLFPKPAGHIMCVLRATARLCGSLNL